MAALIVLEKETCQIYVAQTFVQVRVQRVLCSEHMSPILKTYKTENGF